MMKINYDEKADAVYIELRKGKFAKNQKIDEATIIDLDNRGNVLGIEVLDASKNIPKRFLSKVEERIVAFAE